ncbi:MAG: hypothetical protein SF029_23995 [bacterium]|nr:hypothetical protein [bacterium]
MATRNYLLKLPADAYEALMAVAKSERRVVADVIRIALEEYMKTKGLDISFEVERGRPRQNTDSPDSE